MYYYFVNIEKIIINIHLFLIIYLQYIVFIYIQRLGGVGEIMSAIMPLRS